MTDKKMAGWKRKKIELKAAISHSTESVEKTGQLLREGHQHQATSPLSQTLLQGDQAQLKILYQEQPRQGQQLQHLVPWSIFSGELEPAHAWCKYLHEHERLSFHEIAIILHRHPASMVVLYKRARDKQL